LQPDGQEDTATGMRREVDIRYVVTSLKGLAKHLYEDVYCQRGQMENLIKLHKAQVASDRMSCHSATANQVRLVLHTAAFWLMNGVRAAIRRQTRSPRADHRRTVALSERMARLLRLLRTTIRERLIKIRARVIEYTARIRIQLPSSCPERSLFPNRCVSEQWGRRPDQPPTKAHQFRARCTASESTPIQIADCCRLPAQHTFKKAPLHALLRLMERHTLCDK
jgi:hypothetical protein